MFFWPVFRKHQKISKKLQKFFMVSYYNMNSPKMSSGGCIVSDVNLHKEADEKDEHFLRLLIGNQQNIYAFILAMIHNRNDADDILQETITVMWRSFKDYQPGTSFVAWGISIARNMTLKFFEKNRYSKLKFSSDIEKEIDSIAAKTLESGENRLDALRNCMKKLNLQNMGLIQLHYEEGKPLRQIANERGISIHTMYRVMGRIHKLLQQCVLRSLFPERLV
jgi:RNA polymerase sigma-70 factor, ECF subfamily